MLALFPMRTIVLNSGTSNNLNLYDAAGNPPDPVMVFCNVSGTVSSTSATTPALTTGSGWKAGTMLFLTNTGTISGKAGAAGANGVGYDGDGGWGGSGGQGGTGYANDAVAGSSGGSGGNGSATPGNSGSPGGPAFEALYPVVVTNNGSIIGGTGGPGGTGGVGYGGDGGGGGGGGGGGAHYSMLDGSSPAYYAGGNGGDGADGDGFGRTNGVSNSIASGGNGGYAGVSGNPGSTPDAYSPGISIIVYPGKAGGPAGRAGRTVIAANGASGVQGYAVKGYSNIKFISTGTLTGPTQ